MPGIKGSGKIMLSGLTQGCGNLFEFNTCFELGVVRKIAGDDLLLVEMAHLDGYIGKELSYPRSAIENDCLYGIPLLFQHNPSLPIDIDRFTLDFLDIDILLQVWCSYDQDPEAPFEEGDICNGNYGLRGMIRCS